MIARLTLWLQHSSPTWPLSFRHGSHFSPGLTSLLSKIQSWQQIDRVNSSSSALLPPPCPSFFPEAITTEKDRPFEKIVNGMIGIALWKESLLHQVQSAQVNAANNLQASLDSCLCTPSKVGGLPGSCRGPRAPIALRDTTPKEIWSGNIGRGCDWCPLIHYIAHTCRRLGHGVFEG